MDSVSDLGFKVFGRWVLKWCGSSTKFPIGFVTEGVGHFEVFPCGLESSGLGEPVLEFGEGGGYS